MPDFLFFLLTLLVATLGGLLFTKLRLPAGSFLGALAAAVALNLLCGRHAMYSWVSVALQIISGALIGSKVGRKELRELKQIIVPTLILLLGMMALNICFGVTIVRFSNLDAATALFATTPGGVADMALISEQLGANSAYVAVMQCCRTIIIYVMCPPLFRFIIRRRQHKLRAAIAPLEAASGANKPDTSKESPWKLVGLLAAAAIGGLAGYFAGITAGAIVGGMIGSTIYCVCVGKVRFPKAITHGLLIICGAYIAAQITWQTIRSIPELAVPILIEFVGIIAFIFVLSFLMNRLTKLDYTTCLFASAPGGLQEMAVLADEFGADTLKVAVMQTMRLVFVIMAFPSMIQLLVKLI